MKKLASVECDVSMLSTIYIGQSRNYCVIINRVIYREEETNMSRDYDSLNNFTLNNSLSIRRADKHGKPWSLINENAGAEKSRSFT